ncbi:macrolide-specific efflux protein MacA [Paenibacillus cisolokensis]|uniref:Macrolide-specific efflux protein MacA n=2 Tax=Paenibacillus cisolokensis TaxID=1658519 RepID=A0ABQ4N8E4_9BACL|nr:macrolide-specific efflux protein MacA [Paenibacillus cisolokensis]
MPAALTAILAASLAIAGCSLLPVEEEPLQPPLVEPAQEQLDIVEVGRSDIQTFLKGTANFVSSTVEPLSFKESGGRIKSINVMLGEEVEAGDLLAELETGDLAHQIDMQRLSVERAQLLYKQAESSGANEIDLRLREIDLERELKSLKAMEDRLGQARLVAPIPGVVIFVQTLNTGDSVGAYQPIVTVADPSRVQLTYVASESRELNGLEVGMPVALKYKGKEYAGKVLQTPSSTPLGADPAKAERNAVTIVLGIDNPPPDVQIGHSAEMTIPLQSRKNVIVLPRSAIRSYMGRNYVQIVEGERRKEVDIEVGLTTPTEVEIVKGLEEGQKVVLNN